MEVLTRDECILLFNEMFEKRVKGLAIATKNLIKNHFEDINGIDVIVNGYCLEMSVSKSDLLSKSRKAPLADHRKILWYILKKTNYGVTDIGRYFLKEHTSVMSGIESAKNLIETETDFKNRVIKAMELI